MSKRHIIVETVLWEYEVGKKHCVAWHESTKVVDSLTNIMNMSWDSIEKAKWRRYFCVRPRDIKRWLKPHSLAITRAEQFK